MKTRDNEVTPKEAAKMVGLGIRSIQKMIQDGKLTATKEFGKYFIEKSELYRVFPRAKKDEMERTATQMDVDNARNETENSYLREMVSKLTTDIEFLKKDIEDRKIEQGKIVDALAYNARLLEYKEIAAKSKPPVNELQNRLLNWWPFKKR